MAEKKSIEQLLDSLTYGVELRDRLEKKLVRLVENNKYANLTYMVPILYRKNILKAQCLFPAIENAQKAGGDFEQFVKYYNIQTLYAYLKTKKGLGK